MPSASRSGELDCTSSKGSATFLVALEGEEAARAAQPLSSNPYDSGTLERLQWIGGWMKAAQAVERAADPQPGLSLD